SSAPPKKIAYAEITHCRSVCENPRSVLIDGRATLTIATSRMTMNCAVTIRARAVQRRSASIGISSTFQSLSRSIFRDNDDLPLLFPQLPPQVNSYIADSQTSSY